MIGRLVGTVAVIATVFLPVASHAQGVPGGVERGARDGERAAGPVGAVVGGVIGGVVGGVSGVLGVDERHISTARMFGSGRSFPTTVSLITTFHRNTAFASTDTPW
jgi:hypothetical protein